MARSVNKKWLLVLIMIPLACEKPTENIKIILDTDVIKYTAMVSVTDAQTGNPIDGATIAVSGQGAPNIYELSGKKEIKLSSGMVTIGLHPDVTPEIDQPVRADITIEAPGYRNEIRQLTFKADEKRQVLTIDLFKAGEENSSPVITPPPPVYPNMISLNFKGRCPSRRDVEVRPSVYVSFRKSGSSAAFRYLGYMDKGQISTNLLELNQAYEFQIVYGGEVYRVSQLIEQLTYDLSLDMPAACNI
ncbi:MAG: hypothetical protein V4594_09170 [Bacteroidota bacterium]